MGIFNLSLLSVSLSIDALGIGLAYSIKKIKIGVKARFIISLISFAVTYVSILFGSLIITLIPTVIAKSLGAVLLIGYGTISIYQGIKKQPTDYDFDSSKNIDLKEAFYVGVALSIDSFAGGLSYVIAGYSSHLVPFMTGALQFFFLSVGLFFGSKISNNIKLKSNCFVMISGLIFIALGFLRLSYNQYFSF